ncbi:uncharacterized protein LOC116170098 [Photinus pyralis]|nr:uncharacterized protein LOC116170098 [Photinus pyralis]
MSDSDNSDTPNEILEAASVATLSLLPAKSQQLYMKQYENFVEWCKMKKIKHWTENVFLAFFSEKAKSCKASTLWSLYSMVKATTIVKNDIDISKFPKVVAFLKQQSRGYLAKKSAIFTRDDINKFLLEAPDMTYLMWKVCMIIGITGACRRDELRKMSICDIEDKGNMLVITIPQTKTGKKRIFTITDEILETVHVLELFRKYLVLRPSHTPHNTFFINYRNGKCSTQVVGVHTFGKIPSLIAQYLKIPNFTNYTGHSFRRSSASLLVEAGGDILMLKRHGGWVSSTVAEGYIEDSMASKMEISSKILTGRDGPSTSQLPMNTTGPSTSQVPTHTTGLTSRTTETENLT